MSPRFFLSYQCPIVVRPFGSRFRCDVLDDSGNVVLGCVGDTEADAFGRLSSFIDGELDRRGVPA